MAARDEGGACGVGGDAGDMNDRYIVTVRAALVAIRVMDADRPWMPTTAEVAAYLRMSDSGARRMMGKLSGPDALPIYQDEEGRWRRAE